MGIRSITLLLLLAVAGIGLGVGLTNQSGDAAFPGANGRMVFSHGGIGGQVQLYTRHANGAFSQPLGDAPPAGASDLNAAWSPDASMVAYERFQANETEIRIRDADGTGDSAVPGTDGGRRPAWSPDGTQVVFDREGDLFKVNLDGSGMVNLTEKLDPPAFEADWAPDDSQIAFKTDMGEREPLMLMNPDGSDIIQLEAITGAFEDGNPDWSPDGSKIVFDFHDVKEQHVDVVVVNADGTGRLNLTADDPGVDSVNPVFSPDGTKILYERHSVFTRQRVQGAGFQATELYVMNTDGSDKQNVTQDSLLVEIDPDWGSSEPPATPTPEPGQNVIWGDNRCDGTLDATDGLAVLRHVAALSALSQTQPCPTIEQAITVLQPGLWGDVDCDQDVDTVDDLKVLRVIAGFEVEQPVNCYPIGLVDAVIHY